MKSRIRKDDTVVVTAGRSKGKQGRVLMVQPDANRALIEGANMITKATKPDPKNNQPGGFVKKEASVHISNVMLFCPKCNKGTRIRYAKGDGKKVQRICKKCNSEIGGKGKK